jgi:hypothetical protein
LKNMFHSPPNGKRVAIHTIRTHASYLGSSDNNDGRKISTHRGINPYEHSNECGLVIMD